MLNVFEETPSESDIRLRRVIARAQLTLFTERFIFEPLPDGGFPASADPQAFALVRSDTGWSQLVARDNGGIEPLSVWSFTFPDGLDSTGFAGWLSQYIKARFGVGVFTVTGARPGGGYIEYWGCHRDLHHEVFAELRELTEVQRF